MFKLSLHQLIITAMLFGAMVLGACNKPSEGGSDSQTATNNETNQPPAGASNEQAHAGQSYVGEPPFPIADSSRIVTTASGLKYYIVQQGTGNKPRPGQKVMAMYHGLLTNGDKFDSSYDRRQPFEFTLGQGQVIRGWDEGFQLLSVGSKAILIIPPDLGYGSQSMGNIPSNSTLVFHVELLNING